MNGDINFAVKVYNGLGNRFRTIATAIVYTKYFETELLLNWSSTRGFDETPLTDLIDFEYFSKKYNVKLISNEEYEKIENNSVLLHKKFEGVHENHDKTHNKEIDLSERDNRKQNIKDFFGKKWKNIAVRTGENMLNIFQPEVDSIIKDAWSVFDNAMKDIKPTNHILDKSSKTLKQFSGNTIVHIRRGDATNTEFYSEHKDRYSSDIGKYVRRVRELLDSKYDNVFISTDCSVALNEFKINFPHNCISYEKTFSESVWHKQKLGQVDARVEQHLLSCTNHLLMSEWSTFSDFAKIYADLSTEIV